MDSDGINDIEVKFTNIYVNLAEITIKSLDKQSLILPVTNNNQDVVAQELALTKVINKTLSKRLSGKILLQVETRGQAWYLDPVSLKRFYLADGLSAYQALRQFGLGITNNDLNKIPVAPTSVLPLDYKASKNYSNSLVNRLKGRIVLQVENRGEAWYINPDNGYKYYLANGEEAYKIMRNLSLGISNENIQSIAVGLNY